MLDKARLGHDDCNSMKCEIRTYLMCMNYRCAKSHHPHPLHRTPKPPTSIFYFVRLCIPVNHEFVSKDPVRFADFGNTRPVFEMKMWANEMYRLSLYKTRAANFRSWISFHKTPTVCTKVPTDDCPIWDQQESIHASYRTIEWRVVKIYEREAFLDSGWFMLIDHSLP